MERQTDYSIETIETEGAKGQGNIEGQNASCVCVNVCW